MDSVFSFLFFSFIGWTRVAFFFFFFYLAVDGEKEFWGRHLSTAFASTESGS